MVLDRLKRMKGFSKFIRRFLLGAGILFPLVSLGMELATHGCASSFFDPIPTWAHIVLVLLMPAAVFFPWMGRRRPGTAWETAGTFLHGAGLIPSILYTSAMGVLNIAGLMIMPFMLIYAFVAPGTVLIVPLVMAMTGPLAALVAWFITRKGVWRLPGEKRRRPWRAGLIVGMIAVTATEWSMVSLHLDIGAAVQGHVTHVEMETRGIHAVSHARQSVVNSSSYGHTMARLRTKSREDFLLNLCYNECHAGVFGPLTHLFFNSSKIFGRMPWSLGGSFSREDLRSLYFRVTGIPFSDAPPPRGARQSLSGTRISRDESLDGFAWDEDLGGGSVGARMRGLSMQSSRMDWHVDADSALAHGEWTLEFENRHSNAQEARCQMLLPPGACVSRLTLWINGEPREAAFGARSQVTEAYRQTVAQRRDPVLVNMVGPDRVLTQCFPVPPGGGRMKIRLGITAPLDAQAPAALFMPLIVERNFSIPNGIAHAVWVQSPQALEVSQLWRSAAATKGGGWSWQAEVPQSRLASLSFGVKQPPLPRVWTTDKLAGTEPPVVIVERTQAVPPADGAPMFVMVDASASLRPHAATIREALKLLAKKAPVTLWASTDGEAVEIPLAEVETRLQSSDFAGGRDAVPAFKAALKRLRETSAPATLIWLHGPQAAKISGGEAIKQLFERGGTMPVIHALELEHGRNTFLEEMYDSAPIVSGLRWQGDGADVLAETLLRIHRGPATLAKTRRATTPPADGKEVWDQLARHAVFREVMAAFRGRDRVPVDQAKRAAQHQLVTPYSGAVVLENQGQYDRAGLKPVDEGSTPQIPTMGTPEPSRMLLIILGVFALCLRRRRGIMMRYSS